MEEELDVTRFTRCPLSLAMHEVTSQYMHAPWKVWTMMLNPSKNKGHEAGGAVVYDYWRRQVQLDERICLLVRFSI